MTALSASARRVLRDAAGKLRRASRVDKPRGPAVEEIVAWCRAWDIEPGGRLSRGRLRLDRELMERIAEELALQGEPPLEAALRGLTSAEHAELGHLEDKGLREGPRASRVLVSLPARSPWPGIAGGARECLDVDWRDIVPSAFDGLVQVENLDSFYAFSPARLAGQDPLLGALRRPLVAYRGDRFYGGAFEALARVWSATGRPHAYAGDLDPKGLDIALGSGATHLLAPPLDWLRRHATACHVPEQQEPYRDRLRRHRDSLPEAHPLRGYLALLVDEQRGLRQQWLEPPLVSVALHGERPGRPAERG